MQKPSKSGTVLHLKFDDNELARGIFGPQESHLRSLEDQTGVNIHVRGGEVSIQGEEFKARTVENVLTQLYALLEKGVPVLGADVDRAFRILHDDPQASLHEIFLDSIYIPARRKVIAPKTVGQRAYIEAMRKFELVFGVGPAGTGKTYLAMAMAVTAILKGEVKRIILTRPAVEAGEKLGFLPGDMAEKVNPYLRPLYDALNDMLDFEKTRRMLERQEIEVAPLAFMRGRTLNEAFVILDEAQNCTREQMKMVLTRMGYGTRMVITGDITQSDLPQGKNSGLAEALKLLKGVPGVSLHFLDDRDVVRHPLVARIIAAYDQPSGVNHE